MKLRRLCEAGKRSMWNEFIDHFRKAADRPLLLSYSGDGTPVQTKVNFSFGSGESMVRRSGYSTKEYYVHNCFAMFKDEARQPQVRVLLRDPVPMTDGKTASAAAAIGMDFLPDPRDHGHVGPVVRHVAFDRAQFGTLQKLFRRWFTKKALRPPPAVSSRAPGPLLLLMDWAVATPCSLHDVHKSFFWSLQHSFTNCDLVKNVFISIESCRNSYSQITQVAPSWLAKVLVVEPEEALESPDDLRDLWLACGVDAELIDELVDLRLLFRRGHISVSQSASHDTVFERVMSCLFSLWRFRRFNESRWASVGAACRANLAARLVGLSALVESILNDPRQSSYHLSGFTKAGPEELEFVVTAGLSSYPTDAALMALVTDARVPKRLDFLTAAVADEMYMLLEIRGPVWGLLAKACGLSGGRLRSLVVGAAHCSIAGMEWRIFTEARKEPWCLVTGDIDANLERLRAGPEPDEPTCAKIWHLLHMGWNREVLKEAVGLLGEISWGTKVAEEQHASAAVVSKYHPEMAEEAVCVRAFVHTCRNLLPCLSDGERHVRRMQERLGRLQRKRPQNIGGRQVFISDLMRLISMNIASGRPVPPRARIIANSAHLWARTSLTDQVRYDIRAHVRKSASQLALEDAIADLQERRNIEQVRVAQDSLADKPRLLLSAVKFDESTFAEYERVYKSSAFTSPAAIQEMRSRAVRAPPRLTDAELADLNKMPLWDGSAPAARPPWLGPVCKQRALFCNAVFMFAEPERTVFYKFLFAMQSPFYAMFAPVERIDPQVPLEVVTHENWEQVAMMSWRFEFSVDFASFCPWEALPPVPLGSISVFLGMQHMDDGTLCSDVPSVPLASVLPATLAHGAKKANGPPASSKAMVQPSLLEQFPWLAGALQDRGGAMPSSPALPTNDSTAGKDIQQAEDLTDADYEEPPWNAPPPPHAEALGTCPLSCVGLHLFVQPIPT